VSARFVIASFEDEDDILAATNAARESGLRIVDVYAPYAVHGIEKAMGLRASRLTWVCFLAGAVGLGLTLFYQFWTSALDWPINIGGKPYDSLPAFIPIAFEMTVLFAGMGVVLAMFMRCRLWPGKAAVLPAPRVTDDRFALVVRLDSAAHSAEDVRRLMMRSNVVDFEERIGEEAR
jgi:hypothetical protein